MADEETTASEPVDSFHTTRRKFLKLAGAALGVAAVGSFGGGVLDRVIRLGGRAGLRTWEISPGVVDYNEVPEKVFTTNELRIAQWYDYWPGRFITSFQDYIRRRYNRSIDVRIDIYTNNEELFTWVTQSGRKYDLMFPTNYMAEIMDRAGLLLNVNEAWLPNLQNLADGTKTAFNGKTLGDFLSPRGTPYAFRADGSRISVPYQWGTTGLGYNTDVFAEADIRELGFDVFKHDAWTNSVSGGTTSLAGRMGLLDDMREVLGLGFKAAGWDAQPGPADQKTGIVGSRGEFQWTQNETAPDHVDAATSALQGMKPNLIGFNTQNQGPWLRDQQTFANQGWSGDIIYAIQPYAQVSYPVSYVVPRQGGARWIDSAVLHREARNLWLAHEFMNYFLDEAQGKTITDFNLYATPNLASYDHLAVYPEGCTPGTCLYDPREDTRIYPTDQDLARCDYQQDVGVGVTQTLYIPAWNAIKFG